MSKRFSTIWTIAAVMGPHSDMPVIQPSQNRNRYSGENDHLRIGSKIQQRNNRFKKRK